MRRAKSTALKPQTVVISIIICAAVCLAGVGYVWAKMEVLGLSRDMKKLELRLEDLKRDNDVLQRSYAGMCAHERLVARVRELNLGLAAPLPSQIIRMPSQVVPLAQRTPESQIYAATNHD